MWTFLTLKAHKAPSKAEVFLKMEDYVEVACNPEQIMDPQA